ncbi:MAG: SRPBCC family protein [Gammaproteobacteria bacterium]|nr:SRPBCC family protein [Gammaproteobacteria bacterium]
MSSFSAIVETEVAGQLDTVFKHIVPIELASIFTGYGPLPSVTGTLNQTGAWDAAGQTRTVTLSDGSSASEQLTKYDAPNYFSYTVSEFTGALRFLSTSADGEWWFDTNPATGGTRIKWHYAFNARSIFAAPILWFVTHALWRGYMNKALTLSKDQIEDHKKS